MSSFGSKRLRLLTLPYPDIAFKDSQAISTLILHIPIISHYCIQIT